MRETSIGACALMLAVSLSCGGGDKALRDATEEDLPKLVLQQEDVPGGSQGTDSCGETGADDVFQLGGAIHSFSAAYDVSGIEAQQISCLQSTVGLYRSADEALSYLRGLDAAYFEGEQPAQAPPDAVAQKIKVPKLGDYASGLVIKYAEGSELESHVYQIQIQQRNVRSPITIIGGPDEKVVDRASEYAEKQTERIETVLRPAQ